MAWMQALQSGLAVHIMAGQKPTRLRFLLRQDRRKEALLRRFIQTEIQVQGGLEERQGSHRLILPRLQATFQG